MFSEKFHLKSKTIQGVLTFVLGFAMSKGWVPEVGAEALAADVLALAGAVYAIYGRVVSKGEKLKLRPAK